MQMKRSKNGSMRENIGRASKTTQTNGQKHRAYTDHSKCSHRCCYPTVCVESNRLLVQSAFEPELCKYINAQLYRANCTRIDPQPV